MVELPTALDGFFGDAVLVWGTAVPLQPVTTNAASNTTAAAEHRVIPGEARADVDTRFRRSGARQNERLRDHARVLPSTLPISCALFTEPNRV